MKLIQIALSNFKRGPLTTFFGCVIFAGSLVALALEKVTWDQALEGVGVAVILCGLPDPNVNIKNNSASILIGLVLMASACSKPPVVTTSTKTEIRTRDTTMKGDKVSASINDDLIRVLNELLRQGKKPEIVYRNSPSSPTNMTIKLDPSGGLQADCATDPQVIKDAIKEIMVTNNSTERKVEYIIPQWLVILLISLFILLLGMGVLIIHLLKKNQL